MRNTIINTTVLLMFYLVLVSCSTTTTDEKKIQNRQNTITQKLESKKVFEEAIDLQRKNGFFLSTPKDTLVLINSAYLMEKAIVLDSSNKNIYVNLTKVYIRLDSLTKAIHVLDKLLEIDSNYVEAITSKGFIYERMGEKNKSDTSYKQALDIYNLRLNKTYGDYINKSFLVMLLYGNNKALQELEEIKKLYSEEDISFFITQFNNFDRNIFIQNSLR